VLGSYGYREVRTPMFESTDLFVRSVGESTDIVRKELYTFTDRGDRSLTLRPEGTAPLVRAYLESPVLRQETPARLSYLGPMFRYERPQKGRYRQFWQIGAELLGSKEPAADVEMIDLFVAIMREVGLASAKVLLNSLGDSVCRPVYRERVRDYFGAHLEELCEDDRERWKTNPLRILDCKIPKCQPILAGAPSVLDSLCEPCRTHFDSVLAGLRAMEIDVETAPRLVRGLDYYTRTVFEVIPPEEGAQSTIGGGGRYDRLIELLGGRPTPGVGFATGIERIILNLKRQGVTPPQRDRPQVYIAVQTPAAKLPAVRLASQLRRAGISAIASPSERSLKAQMRQADSLGATFVAILGESELAEETATLRRLESGEQETVPLTRVASRIGSIQTA
jgi:histidyl-tRNA synthetase